MLCCVRCAVSYGWYSVEPYCLQLWGASQVVFPVSYSIDAGSNSCVCCVDKTEMQPLLVTLACVWLGADKVDSEEEAINHEFVTAMVKGDVSTGKGQPGSYVVCTL